MHFAQLDEHGGLHGTRDINALESALARPRQKHAYARDADLADLAAAYAFGLARGHAYADGNKRIAFIVAEVFLELNGFDVERTDAEVVETMVRVAEGKLTEEALARWFREALTPLR